MSDNRRDARDPDRPVVEGDVLWAPSDALRRDSLMTAFLARATATQGHRFDDYGAAWRWSVEEPEAFWQAIVDFFEIPFRAPPTRILADDRMPGAVWR